MSNILLSFICSISLITPPVQLKAQSATESDELDIPNLTDLGKDPLEVFNDWRPAIEGEETSTCFNSGASIFELANNPDALFALGKERALLRRLKILDASDAYTVDCPIPVSEIPFEENSEDWLVSSCQRIEEVTLSSLPKTESCTRFKEHHENLGIGSDVLGITPRPEQIAAKFFEALEESADPEAVGVPAMVAIAIVGSAVGGIIANEFDRWRDSNSEPVAPPPPPVGADPGKDQNNQAGNGTSNDPNNDPTGPKDPGAAEDGEAKFWDDYADGVAKHDPKDEDEAQAQEAIIEAAREAAEAAREAAEAAREAAEAASDKPVTPSTCGDQTCIDALFQTVFGAAISDQRMCEVQSLETGGGEGGLIAPPQPRAISTPSELESCQVRLVSASCGTAGGDDEDCAVDFETPSEIAERAELQKIMNAGCVNPGLCELIRAKAISELTGVDLGLPAGISSLCGSFDDEILQFAEDKVSVPSTENTYIPTEDANEQCIVLSFNRYCGVEADCIEEYYKGEGVELTNLRFRFLDYLPNAFIGDNPQCRSLSFASRLVGENWTELDPDVFDPEDDLTDIPTLPEYQPPITKAEKLENALADAQGAALDAIPSDAIGAVLAVSGQRIKQMTRADRDDSEFWKLMCE